MDPRGGSDETSAVMDASQDRKQSYFTLRLILTFGESSMKQAVNDEACAPGVGTKVNEMFQLEAQMTAE